MDNMESVFGSRWLLQFNEHKALRAVFNEEFEDRRFDVREFNKVKFIAVLGPTDRSVSDKSSAILNDSAEAKQIIAQFKARLDLSISSLPGNECNTAKRCTRSQS